MLTSILKNTITELYYIEVNKNKRLHRVDNYLKLLINYFVNNLHLN